MAKDFYSQDDEKSYQKTVALCIAAASLVVLIFLAVLYKDSAGNKKSVANNKNVSESVSEEEFLSNTHNFTSDELDFWESAEPVSQPEEEPETEKTQYRTKDDIDKDIRERLKEKADRENVSGAENEEDASSDENDGSLNKNPDDEPKYDDDKHIAVDDGKGGKKYYEILSDVDKNDYDFDNCLDLSEDEISYSDSKRDSLKGIDLSKYNGDIDWKKVKDADVDFAMLRLGSRGYGSGLIELDEKFVEYAQNAALNNIPIGAYFYSQAVNEIEAIEEANYIVGAITSFNVKYPIAIDVEKVSGDEARTDKLSVSDRTHFVKLFCDTVKSYGYKPIIYADRDMLITGLDLKELNGYDVWLADSKVPTDYPYKFSMWQYTNKGRIDGISGEVDLNLGFVDYEKR